MSQFFPRVAVDQTSGNIVLCWYDARNASLLDLSKVELFATCGTYDENVGSVDFDTLETNEMVISDAVSEGDPDTEFEPVAPRPEETRQSTLGDYIWLYFRAGAFYPAWGDNSFFDADGNGVDDRKNPDNGTETFVKRMEVEVEP